MNFIHAYYASLVWFLKNTIAIVYLGTRPKPAFALNHAKRMKIILQPEAKTIGNFEIAKNQQDLIDFMRKLRCFNFRLPKKATETKCSP